MIDLAQRSEPYEIPLPYGLKVTVRPLTTAGMTAAQAAARRAIERQARERKEAGLQLDGLPDLSGEGERDGFYQAQLIRELGVRHITRSHGSNGALLRRRPISTSARMSSSMCWRVNSVREASFLKEHRDLVPIERGP
jgi:hypothetical protein